MLEARILTIGSWPFFLPYSPECLEEVFCEVRE